MPYWPPDTPPPADGVPQMPAAPNSGPAPVPYAGGDQAPEPPLYSVPPLGDARGATAGVMAGVSGANHVMEAPLAAPNPNPYDAGVTSPVMFHADADPGGRSRAPASACRAGNAGRTAARG